MVAAWLLPWLGDNGESESFPGSQAATTEDAKEAKADMTNTPLYVVAYRQCAKASAPWYRRGFFPTPAIAQGEAEALQKYPYIVAGAVFDLSTWNYGQPAGDPLWKFER